jgi:GT2 family glycosyltransferase
MKQADIIFVADTSKHSLYVMTHLAIRTCLRSEPGMKLNIIVVDGNKHAGGFESTKTIIYDGAFNYNHCLNIGLQYSTAPYVALCNNDLLFSPNWLTNVIKYMEKGYHSASPFHRQTTRKGAQEGYRIEKEVLGWCIVCTRELIDKIGKLDETCSFWFSDNIYAEQIKKAGYKHILVYDSYVRHLESKTLSKATNHRELTKGQYKLFEQFLNKQKCESVS